MWTIFLLFGLSCQSVLSVDYEFRPDDPDIFSDCRNPPGPPGSTNINGLFNLDELQLSLNGDMVHFEGNLTTVWDIQPQDRIAIKGTVMRWDRGVWEPTIFSVSTDDFCQVMYDKDQYWYRYWTTHVTNADEVGSKCLYLKGSKLMHEPFDINLVIYGVNAVSMLGRYKIVVTLDAFDDQKKIKRPTVCVEIKGEMEEL
ncbi:GH19860 [Drosophila grimshawi]|uniref:GH19860 n=2 Tax=Drosophila grimshawi TaxID=7222 RepID=B4J9H8_DROGR|nr:GH19860 [Drosophila grimshawi]